MTKDNSGSPASSGHLLNMISRHPLWLLVSFVEGAALMAVELMAAKFVAPFYGNSIYVWSAVLGMTLGGLASGYFLGSWLARRGSNAKFLRIGLLSAAVLIALLPFSSEAILLFSLQTSSLQAGILLSTLAIIYPPLLVFGTVSPLIIGLLAPQKELSGAATGLVYAISTLGGILATFVFAFWLIPYSGLTFSSILVAVALFTSFAFSFFGRNH